MEERSEVERLLDRRCDFTVLSTQAAVSADFLRKGIIL
jgi:hypothetical protein